jgi:predicted phage-related endonuclease
MDDTLREARRKGIGGSDIPKLTGVSNYGGEYSVWLSKMGMDTSEPKFSFAREYGTEAEELLLRLWRRERESKGEPVEYVHQPGTVTQDGILMANVDALVTTEKGELIIADVKTARLSTSQNWGKRGTSVIPRAYFQQLQWYMGIYRMAGWAIETGMIIREMDHQLDEFYVPFCQQTFDDLVATAKNFWRTFVETGQAPETDNSEECRFYLEATYKDPAPEKRAATVADLPAITRYVKAANAKKAAEIELGAAKNGLKKRIGDDYGIKGEFGAVSWSRKGNGRFTPKISEHWDPYDPTRKV